jgi:seryl-tRNA synthetase
LISYTLCFVQISQISSTETKQNLQKFQNWIRKPQRKKKKQNLPKTSQLKSRRRKLLKSADHLLHKNEAKNNNTKRRKKKKKSLGEGFFRSDDVHGRHDGDGKSH